jgi:hypothetical protein
MNKVLREADIGWMKLHLDIKLKEMRETVKSISTEAVTEDTETL